MGGWTGIGKDTIRWEGNLIAGAFQGDGSNLTGVTPDLSDYLTISAASGAFLALDTSNGPLTGNLEVDNTLVVGVDQADLAFMTSKAKIVANTNGVSGVQMGNIGTGSGTDFRFIIKDATDHYFAFSQPGVSNTGTLWGKTRSTFDTIFNTSGTSRDLIISSQNDLFLGAGGLVAGDIRLIVEADGDVKIPLDNVSLTLGNADDASITYDGTNLIINPKEVGSGILDVQGTIQTDGYNSADGTAGATGTIDLTTITSITVKNGLITAWS